MTRDHSGRGTRAKDGMGQKHDEDIFHLISGHQAGLLLAQGLLGCCVVTGDFSGAVEEGILRSLPLFFILFHLFNNLFPVCL